MTFSDKFPILEDRVKTTSSSSLSEDDTLRIQHRYTTARAVQLVTEALQLSARLSRLTVRAQELERDLKDVIEETEGTDPAAV